MWRDLKPRRYLPWQSHQRKTPARRNAWARAGQGPMRISWATSEPGLGMNEEEHGSCLHQLVPDLTLGEVVCLDCLKIRLRESWGLYNNT